MNIPYRLLKDEKSPYREYFNYHQSLAKRLYNSSKKIKSFDPSAQNPMNNYLKKKIYKWLFSLDMQIRVKICTIYNEWFTKILFQLLTYNEYDCKIRFSPKEFYEDFYKSIHCKTKKDNKINMEDEKNISIIDLFNNYFEGITQDINDKNINKNQQREKDFLKEIRFYSLNKFNDSFTLSFDLLNTKTKLQEYFDTFTKCKIFTDNITISTKAKNNSNIYNFSIPNWVSEYDTFSVQQIFVICFEQISFM
jgi:hypothetical protein